jgi:hypothetical protein
VQIVGLGEAASRREIKQLSLLSTLSPVIINLLSLEISPAFMPTEYMHYLLAYGCASLEGPPWRKMGI